jgi:para-nitrobenzyl esterase
MSNKSTLACPGGNISGIQNENGSLEFLGIRFASAKRFEAPVDIDSWSGTCDATKFGSISPQVPGMLETMLGFNPADMDEDCLFLNVYASETPSQDTKKPVLVWIHGGAYTNGSGSTAWYHGGTLASQGSIVVSINYRLGALGFLGDGNYGTLDMVSALRWVNKNIAAFGGDANNVTIFGESAGGSAVISLMACPSAKGLFHRVWAMSPSIGQLREHARSQELAKQFFEIAGVSTIDDLRDMSLEKILEFQTAQLLTASSAFDFYAPTGGGIGLEPNILEVASKSAVQFVVGTNRDENKLWSAFDPRLADANASTWEESSTETFGSRAAEARKVYEKLRPNESPKDLISAVSTDTGFRQRAISFAEQRVSASQPTWMYWFTWQTPAMDGILGCCHALDIPFAFGNLEAPGAEMFLGDGSDRQPIADRFTAEITQFAHHGHPSWSQYDTDTRATLRIDEKTELILDPEQEIRALFSQ